jgi:hypothetical protein
VKEGDWDLQNSGEGSKEVMKVLREVIIGKRKAQVFPEPWR